MNVQHCTDPLIGNILAGWRYGHLRASSPAMRTDYDQHLSDCAHRRRRQHLARTIDVLLLTVSSLSILAFMLAAAVLHRIGVHRPPKQQPARPPLPHADHGLA